MIGKILAKWKVMQIKLCQPARGYTAYGYLNCINHYSAIFDKETKKPAWIFLMSRQSLHFEEILLPPVILAGLYSNSLVVIDKPVIPAKTSREDIVNVLPVPGIDAPAKPTITVAEPQVDYELTANENIGKLGDFNRQILVLVNDSSSLHLAEAELETLGKMIQALKLSFADIAIVNTAHQKINWQTLQNQLPARQVILFGVEPADIQIPIRLPHFRVQTWSNIRFLYSPSLAEITMVRPEQQQLKMSLWTAIKELFAAG